MVFRVSINTSVRMIELVGNNYLKYTLTSIVSNTAQPATLESHSTEDVIDSLKILTACMID
jgi:hypothetical protein